MNLPALLLPVLMVLVDPPESLRTRMVLQRLVAVHGPVVLVVEPG
jgi:hypothetical protein